MNIELLQKILSDSISYIEKRAISEEGIYRIPGSDAQAKELILQYINHKQINIMDVADPFTITTMLKYAIRQLREPIVPVFAYPALKAILQLTTDNQKPKQAMKDLVNNLIPSKNMQVLLMLCNHIYKIAENESENKMGVNNLVMVFAPTLLSSGSNDALQEMKDNPSLLFTLFSYFRENSQ